MITATKKQEITKKYHFKYFAVYNPFVPNAPYLYPLKTSENCKVF